MNKEHIVSKSFSSKNVSSYTNVNYALFRIPNLTPKKFQKENLFLDRIPRYAIMINYKSRKYLISTWLTPEIPISIKKLAVMSNKVLRNRKYP